MRDDVRTRFLPLCLRLDGGGINVFFSPPMRPVVHVVIVFFFYAHPDVPDFSESFKMLQPESIELRMTVKASPRTAGRDIQVQDTFSRISEIPFPPLGSSKKKKKNSQNKLTV